LQATVEFHTGVARPLDFACRLLRKAWRTGARLGVTAPAPGLAELDRLLWLFEEREFLPHARTDAPEAARLLRHSPVWISSHPQALVRAADEHALALPPVLVNLGADAPGPGTGFLRVIEIVGDDADLADAARLRWRGYKALGLEIVHHAARVP